jgi:antitoxin component of MazEF toxin-antitoxin module
MITSKLRKSGNSYIVTVPREEIERQGLFEGQVLAVEVRPVEMRPILNPELREAFEESWEQNAEGYRYLAGR